MSWSVIIICLMTSVSLALALSNLSKWLDHGDQDCLESTIVFSLYFAAGLSLLWVA